ncbi:MAG: EAL domain-containing protein [Rhodospirillales bacterium]
MATADVAQDGAHAASGATGAPAVEKANGDGRMKSERDRFLAFAFCRNDLLVELDPEAKISFVGGPTEPLLASKIQDLMGKPFVEIVDEQDRILVQQLLKAADRGERMKRSVITLVDPNGKAKGRFELNGYKFGDMKGHYFLALRADLDAVRPGSAPRDSETGMMSQGEFAHVAAEKVKELRESGEEAEMTMVNMPELDDLLERLDDQESQELLEKLANRIRANSLSGDTATRIGSSGFGLVHDSSFDLDSMQQQLLELTKVADPEGKGVQVDAATTTFSPSLSEEDMTSGLLFAMNQFRESEGGSLKMSDLAGQLNSLAEEAAKYVSTFTAAVDAEEFDLAFQPIADSKTGDVHHYEVLARFRLAEGESPYQYIVFAEETNRIHTFDLAVVKKVVSWLKRQPINTSRTVLAINISGRSVGNDIYVKGLVKVLDDNRWLADKLMFEITESARLDDMRAANDFIQNIRNRGFHVCLDDFGAGAASFQYLSSLDVDVVKLDGPAVKNAIAMPKGRAFLSALAELCEKLNIETIAEMIETPEELRFVRDCGVDYVQGYLIGKPGPDIKSFKKKPDPKLFKR